MTDHLRQAMSDNLLNQIVDERKKYYETCGKIYELREEAVKARDSLVELLKQKEELKGKMKKAFSKKETKNLQAQFDELSSAEMAQGRIINGNKATSDTLIETLKNYIYEGFMEVPGYSG